jgi:hypothetical protein
MPPRKKNYKKRQQAKSKAAFRGKRLAIARVPRPINYRHRAAYMKTQETYKFFIDPKITGGSADGTQHPIMIDLVLNSPYTFRTTYLSTGTAMIANSEPTIVKYDGTNGDVATVTPGLYEDASRPGGERGSTTPYVGAKFTTGMVVGAKVQSNFTPVLATDGASVQPGYIAHIRSSGNDYGGIQQATGNYTTLSKLPFVQWKRVRGPAISNIAGSVAAPEIADKLSRSVTLTTKHSVAKWNNVSDLNDCKDRFSFHLSNPDDPAQTQELDHLSWILIPELEKATLGKAVQTCAGVLTLTINKTIKFSEPLSGKGDIGTANLPPVWGSTYMKPLIKRYGAGALYNASKSYAYRHRN